MKAKVLAGGLEALNNCQFCNGTGKQNLATSTSSICEICNGTGLTLEPVTPISEKLHVGPAGPVEELSNEEFDRQYSEEFNHLQNHIADTGKLVVEQSASLEDRLMAIFQQVYYGNKGTYIDCMKAAYELGQQSQSQQEAIVKERISAYNMIIEMSKSYSDKAQNQTYLSMQRVICNEQSGALRNLANSMVGRNGLNTHIPLEELILTQLHNGK